MGQAVLAWGYGDPVLLSQELLVMGRDRLVTLTTHTLNAPLGMLLSWKRVLLLLLKHDFYKANATLDSLEGTLDIFTGLTLGPLDDLQK